MGLFGCGRTYFEDIYSPGGTVLLMAKKLVEKLYRDALYVHLVRHGCPRLLAYIMIRLVC